MNTSYRLVSNRKTKQLQVAPETARGHGTAGAARHAPACPALGTSAPASRLGRLAQAVLLALAALAPVTAAAMCQYVVDPGTNVECTLDDAIDSANTAPDSTITIGTNTTRLYTVLPTITASTTITSASAVTITANRGITGIVLRGSAISLTVGANISLTAGDGNSGSSTTLTAGADGADGVTGTNFTLINAGNITAGVGGRSYNVGGAGGAGGSGVDGTGFTLDNSGTISGGEGGTSASGTGGVGGSGVAGTNFKLTNSGAITGGKGGWSNDTLYSGGKGGAGVSGTGFTLINSRSGTITGGTGSYSASMTISAYGPSGVGGSGVDGTGFTLDNSGTIKGGQGGKNYGATAGTGGVGVSGTSFKLTNSGTIYGGYGGYGPLQTGGTGGTGVGGTGFTLDNSGAIYGGTGGSSEGLSSGNGKGGNGGSGVDGTGFTLTNSNSGTVTGGGGNAFVGGNGGAGVSGSGFTLTNAGTISGGAGILGSYEQNGGTGGIGVVATGSSTITNSGTIAGGLASDNVTRAAAVDLSGGNNILNLLAGSIITGDVVSNSVSDTINSATGSITGNLSNAGTLAVGSTATTVASNATLSVTGNYTQAAGATFQTAVSSAASYGKLAVSGTASLPADAKIAVDVASANTLANGQTLAGVISAGTLNASTFKVTDNSYLFDFSASTNANAVDLQVSLASSGSTTDPTTTSTATTLVTRALTASGFSAGLGAARVLDQLLVGGTSGDMSNVITALGRLSTGQQVSNAVSQTLPFTASASDATLGVLNNNQRLIAARQSASRGLPSGDEFVSDRNLWFKPFGSWADQRDQGSVSGYTSRTAGLALGADGELNAQTRLGLGLFYSNTHVTGNSDVANQSGSVDAYQAVIYGSRQLDETTTLNVQADLGSNTTNSSRSLNFGGLVRVAKADYRGVSAHLGASVERALAIDESAVFTPSLRADYTYLRNRGYTETGADALNLQVDAQSVDQLIFGVDGAYSQRLNERASLIANLGVGYDALAGAGSITSSYVGGGAAFSTPGIDAKPWLVRGGVGLLMRGGDKLEVTARYDVEAREGFTEQSASINLRMPF